MSENNKLTIEEALAVTAGAVKKWIEENPEIGSSGNSIYVFMGDVREDLNSGSATGKWSESKLRKTTDRPILVGDLILDFSNNLCSISSVFNDGTFNLAYIHNIGTGGTGDGTPGKDGTTFYPQVSEDGTLSWTNDGGLPNPSPINIKGAPGDDYVLTEADLQIIAELAAGKVKIPEYGGDYEVTPSASGDITLKTAQTFVTGDVVVKKISYRTEQNSAGGETVYIGGE